MLNPNKIAPAATFHARVIFWAFHSARMEAEARAALAHAAGPQRVALTRQINVAASYNDAAVNWLAGVV